MKKKKLNSKNPKYWDKSQLTEKKVIKEVKGKAAIRNSSGNIVGETTVRGVWYEQCYTYPDNLREFRGEVCARRVVEVQRSG